MSRFSLRKVRRITQFHLHQVCLFRSTLAKLTNRQIFSKKHNHDDAMHRSEKIIISNTIERKAEVSANLREVFNDTRRGLNEASSLAFKSLESSMFKRRRILQPKMPPPVYNSISSCKNHLVSLIICKR